MSTQMNWKIVVVAGLLVAALVGRSTSYYGIAILVLGVFNTLATVPGTFGVRVVAIIAAATALLGVVAPEVMIVFVVWVWPPAFLVGWAIARRRDGVEEIDDTSAGRRARNTVAVAIGAIACAVLLYKTLEGGGMLQTALLFVGIPALIAIIVTLGVTARTATGVACKAVTVGLLVSLIFLGEGFLCIAMSAPLFYAVAVGIATATTRMRHGTGAQRTLSGFMLLAFVPMSLEGITPAASLDRDESISVTKTIDASFAEVTSALLETPRFDRELPLYLRMGFPRPLTTDIDRRGPHPRWVIQLRGGETRFNGTEPTTGGLMLELDEARPGFVHWRVLADGSHMTHFLRWRDSSVRWEWVGPASTQVTWTLRYRRGLDPAWYFGPWERYAVHLAARYLIDTVATP